MRPSDPFNLLLSMYVDLGSYLLAPVSGNLWFPLFPDISCSLGFSNLGDVESLRRGDVVSSFLP